MLRARLGSASLAFRMLVTACLLVGWLSAAVVGQEESPAAIPAESPAAGSVQ
jgi:hypothetical protein